MKKILAVLFACSIVLAGCMDLTDDDVDAIVDAIVEIPGCNADETAYNYDVNASNNNACLTEMVLKDSISEFITTIGSQPAADQTTGIMQEGSDGAGGEWESVEVTSPSGLYNSMDVDMGVFAWSQSELITAAADGTTLIQVDWDGNEMLMNSAAQYNSWATPMSDSNMDDDDMDMDMGMGMDGMEMPSVEIPEDFDPSQALYEAGMTTDKGYSFTTTMDIGMDYTATMTFTLGMDLVVDSMTMVETMDGETSTSTVTMMDVETSLGYLNIDPNLPYEALPFTISPMGGMDNGHDDNNGNDGTYVDAFLTDNWASSLNDYSEPEFTIYSGFDNVNRVHFVLFDMDGNAITSMTIQPMDFSDAGDGNMIYYVDINHLLTDVGCYTLEATVTTHEGTQSDWIRDDICNYGDDDGSGEDEVFVCDNGYEIPADYVNDGSDDCGDGSDEYDYEEQFVFECLYITVNDNLVYDSEGTVDREASWDETGLDDTMCDTEVENPDDYQVVDNGVNNLPSNFSAWEEDDNMVENMSIGDDNYVYVKVTQDSDDDCDGTYDSSTNTCLISSEMMISQSNEDMMTWTMTYQSSFNCLDGEQIMHEYANDGNADCNDGTDEPTYEDGYETSYYQCFDGGYILISQVNDGIEDCETSGEDETGIIEINLTVLYQFNSDTGSGLLVAITEPDGLDEDGNADWITFSYCEWEGDSFDGDTRWYCTDNQDGSDGFDDWWYLCELDSGDGMWYCTDDYGQSSDWEFTADDTRHLDEGPDDHDDSDDPNIYDGCTESNDPNDSYYECWMNEWLDEDGEIISSDGYDMEQCFEIDEAMWECYPEDNTNQDSPEELLAEADTDGSEGMSFDEFEVVFSDGAGDEIPQDMISDLQDIFNYQDLDASGEIELSEMDSFIAEVDQYLMSLDEENYDDDDGPPTASDLIDMADTDDSGTLSVDEFFDFMNSPDDPDGGGDGDESLPQSMVDEINAIFDNNDADLSGDLDLDELDQFILDIDEYFMSMDGVDGEMFTCDNGNEVPEDYVDDGDNDCGDWSDEPNHNGDNGEQYFDCDNGNQVPAGYYDDGDNDCGDWSDEPNHSGDDDNGMGDGHSGDGESMYDWMISNSHDMPMEGSFSDYSIVLAMCTMDESDGSDDMMGMEASSTMDCEDDAFKVSVADALNADDSSVLMFHDTDMSGTISDGDMVHINSDTVVESQWNTVRLHSTSADAYSDENPMQTPGFTGIVGLIALLGAALLTRRD